MEFPATDLVVKLVETEDERAAAYAIRIRVFVEEQGVPIEEELDHDDELASHAIAYWGGTPVGTGRMVYGWPHDASSQKVPGSGVWLWKVRTATGVSEAGFSGHWRMKLDDKV